MAFIELPPLASRYDMYAKTHASPEDYDRENPGIGRRILTEDNRGIRTDLTECASDLSEPIWATLGTLEAGAPLPSTAPLKTCHGDSAPQRYLLMEDRCFFDWNAGGFYCVYRDKLIRDASRLRLRRQSGQASATAPVGVGSAARPVNSKLKR